MDEKTAKIIDAATALFLRHGYRKVTMGEIAEGAGMSRPSLYAVFENKEAVIAGLLDRVSAANESEAKAALASLRTPRARLERLFEIWIIGPFESVIHTSAGNELLATCAAYAPEAFDRLYDRFEAQLVAILKDTAPAGRGKRPMSLGDLAHLMTLATKGLKASTPSVAELRRLVAGLITMALVLTEKDPST